MRAFSLVVGALLLSGCASLTARTGPATMEADPSEVGPEGVALQNQLLLAYTKDEPTWAATGAANLCKFTKPSYQEKDRYSVSRQKRGLLSEFPSSFECLYLRESPTAPQVKSHLDAGLSLSDLYCGTYFRRISRRWNERLFLRNTTNDVGAAISAVLGLAKAGSAITGGVGTGFGLSDSLFRNYDNVFVVTPELARVQALVRKNQRSLRDEWGSAGKEPKTYSDAQDRIIEYANLCSYLGMKTLLDAAVDKSINDLSGPTAIKEAALKGVKAGLELEKQKADAAEGELAQKRREKIARDQIAKEFPVK